MKNKNSKLKYINTKVKIVWTIRVMINFGESIKNLLSLMDYQQSILTQSIKIFNLYVNINLIVKRINFKTVQWIKIKLKSMKPNKNPLSTKQLKVF